MRIIQLSYESSMMFRGIAILMMIFLHCFNYHSQNDYIDLIINGNTLSWWLTKTAGLCVAFYCFLSGYGLYKKYPYGYKYCLEKAWILIKRYWFFLVLFVGIGAFVFNAYELNVSTLFSNFFGYNTTYNPTLWFLLPYLLVMVTSPLLLKIFTTHKTWKSIALVVVAYGGAFYCLKMKSIGVIAIPDVLYVVLESFHLLFSFMCGALLAKYGIPKLKIMRNMVINNFALIVLIAVLVLVRSLIDSSILSPVLCLILIVLLANLHFADGLMRLFEELGRHSLDMWFIHAYFTYKYLDFTVYWLRYPLFIFLAVVIYSYVLSKLFDIVLKRLDIIRIK